jgi:7-keto-8-aminopelargonate synthetase-like enzyme
MASVLRYGVQFSTSRAYVAAPPYAELEQMLSEMAGGAPVVLAATTSLAHLGALPVLVGERDAVLYDAQVHASVQTVLPRAAPARHRGRARASQPARPRRATRPGAFA